MLGNCGFCGGADGPFTRVEGVFTMLMCPACLATRARDRGPYPELTDAELRGGLDLLPYLDAVPEGSGLLCTNCERTALVAPWLSQCRPSPVPPSPSRHLPP